MGKEFSRCSGFGLGLIEMFLGTVFGVSSFPRNGNRIVCHSVGGVCMVGHGLAWRLLFTVVLSYWH